MIFNLESQPAIKPERLSRPLFSRSPVIPALRHGPTAVSEAFRQK
jgi:hypothetical protein